MADFDTEYSVASSRSEVLNRPDKTYAIDGQAGFLAVALALNIPIFSAQNSIIPSSNPIAAGLGASFDVSTSVTEFNPDPRTDFINSTRQTLTWLKANNSAQRFRRHVTKRIVTKVHADDEVEVNDACQLAGIVNEIRILSSETMRQCDFIVSMLGVSWYETPSVGRFWPQLLLEAADEGNLEEYLTGNEVGFKTQLALIMQVERGLAFLHEHGIVHGDLKPKNVLVFTQGLSAEKQQLCSSIGVEPLLTKICDFGYAVILSDYASDAIFQARVGTVPWMPPELDIQDSVPLTLLHKADVFGLGLLAASIFMKGATPFDGLSLEEITTIKTNAWNQPTTTVTEVMRNITEKVALNEYQTEYIEGFLRGTCSASSRKRVCLPAIESFLYLGLLQDIELGAPTIPTNIFPDLQDADPGYWYVRIEYSGTESDFIIGML